MEKKVYEFISHQIHDPILERKTCRRCGSDFPVFEGDKSLLEKLSPTIGGKKFALPLPKHCPDCRQRHRLMFRNERSLYKRTCDTCGKHMIAAYAAGNPGKIICMDCRNDDQRENHPLDMQGSFVESYRKLLNTIGTQALVVDANSRLNNSQYVNFATDAKDSYLCYAANFVEKCFYSDHIYNGTWCVDCSGVNDSEIAYQCIEGKKLFKCFYCEECTNCTECIGCTNCENCNFCFGSHNLTNSEYYFFNKKLDKDTYHQKVAQYQKNNPMRFIAHKDNIKRAVFQLNSEGCIGNNLINCKNAIFCFDGSDAQDCRYGGYFMDNMKNTMDVEGAGAKLELSYQGVAVGIGAYRDIAVSYALGTHDSLYSIFLTSCGHCIGCLGLKNKEYHILNKQYTKAEYEKLAQQIIGELQDGGQFGAFLDPSLNRFPYNDSTANDYFPIGKGTVTVLEPEKTISKAILDLGGEEKIPILRKTKNIEINMPEGIKTIQASQLPKDIAEVNDDILDQAIICEQSGRAFRIAAQELAFYRKYHLPLPRKHPEVRFQERFARKAGRQFSIRHCDKCEIETLSVYPQNSEFKVYCEACYNKEIYG